MSTDRQSGPPGRARAAKSSRSRRLEYLTPTEVADLLLVEPVTVRLWASRGLLPSVTTPGGHRRFRVEEVEAFIARRQAVAEGADMPTSRLLIIDDDAQFARYLSSLLSSRAPALNVDIALDGFSAGIKCQAQLPDVVTLDLHMPDLDGFTVCRLLRTMFGQHKPRIVALSGHLSAQNTERILAAGANACLPKNTAPDVLLAEIGVVPRAPAGAGTSASESAP